MIKLNLKHMLMMLSLSSAMLFVACNSDSDEDPTPEAPVAGFTVSQDGAVVTLTNTSTGDIDSYAWDFGDGTQSSSENPEKTYTSSGTFTISLTVTGPGGTSEPFTDDVTISAGAVDETGPVITLVGDPAITIEIGDEYTDEGATAEDNVDGTVSVTTEGEVNTLQPGEYTITYSAVDAAGNEAAEVTRTVTVTYDPGILVNGDFQETGTAPWVLAIAGEGDLAPEIQENEGNKFFFFNNEGTTPNNFDLQLLQLLTLSPNATYELSFNASTGAGETRTFITGIGQNFGDFADDRQEVTITETETRYTVELSAIGFGGPNPDHKLFFFFGGDAGVVVLDNLSLVLTEEGPGGGTGACEGDLIAAEALPMDFEGCETFLSSLNFGGRLVTEIEDNPSVDATNGSSYAFKATKFEGANRFGGFQNIFATPMDFTNDPLTLKVYSTQANTTYRFELNISNRQPTDPGNPGVAFVEVPEANQWVEIEVEFPGFPGAKDVYDQLIIKPDNPNGTDGETTSETHSYYFDDISAPMASAGGGGGGGGATGDNLLTNGDFETGDLTGWLAFPNGGTSEYDGTRNNGGNGSGRITLAAAGNPALKQERFGGGTVAAGDVVRVQFDINGVLTPPGAVCNVLLFGEQAAGGASFTHVFNPPPVLNGTWTTFSADYTIPDGLDVGEGLSLLIEGVCGADAGCAVEFNIDNVSLSLNPQ